ncbi:MAG: phosphate ABC transporter permease PstA [Bdellovibrionales bacterium]|nr:phosphate ABC transporter permease PstA [Bdellovibrionales bacterium]
MSWNETKQLKKRKILGKIFSGLCTMAAFSSVVLLVVLLSKVFFDGWAYLDWQFVTSFPSRFFEKAGIQSALMGSLWVISLTCMIAVPIGVGASIYLEEFAPKNRFTHLIHLNISNLAGVPSIVYGILGLVIFVRGFGFGRSILSASLTTALLILPIIIIASKEAIKSIPNSTRYAALALGASKWQTVRDHVIPSALPSIMTGMILAISRAIGESAPLLIIGALGYVAFNPQGPMDAFTVLPIQIFNWAARPQAEFHQLAAAGIIVLLVVLLLMNSIAIFIRYRYQRKLR